jgi:predicted dehydrogenase
MTKNNVSRRSFLKTTTAAAGTLGVLGVPATVHAKNGNGRMRVGFIGTGMQCRCHIDKVLNLQQQNKGVEAAAVCDVYVRNLDRVAGAIKDAVGADPITTGDYRDIINDKDIDIVCIATPDHWHAKMTIEALRAGKHVYCEKPMTHTVPEATDVVNAWKQSGKIMQVGVQGTSDGRWKAANQFIREGGIGKIVQAQTSYYRNSGVGQWRYYSLSRDMTPKNIDWKMFLGTEFGLAPDMPFDRAKFGQWRCYWPFGSGLYTDLFVHRLTQLITAVGVRYPRRVVGGGGIFLEYDGRNVPDTATIAADYDEGCQILISGTMCNNFMIQPCIRGHHGTIDFDMSADGFEFLPQRPQVSRISDVQPKHVSAPKPKDQILAQWENFLAAIEKNDPQACNNPPDLGAAAVITVTLGAESYRNGKVYEFDADSGAVRESGTEYAKTWEAMSKDHAALRHIPGWAPTNKDPMFSRQIPKDYQKLEGPWKDGIDPAK